jgi:exodeoxyribonuclease VII small subunit
MESSKSNYNQDIAHIRRLVSEIENEDVDVDLLAEKVKEAAILIKRCKDKLFLVDEDVKKVLIELEE